MKIEIVSKRTNKWTDGHKKHQYSIQQTPEVVGSVVFLIEFTLNKKALYDRSICESRIFFVRSA